MNRVLRVVVASIGLLLYCLAVLTIGIFSGIGVGFFIASTFGAEYLVAAGILGVSVGIGVSLGASTVFSDQLSNLSDMLYGR